MGNVFWILIWDDWGCGLNMINPRLFTVYDQITMITRNSFSCRTEGDIKDFLKRYHVEENHGDLYRVIRSGE